MALPIRPNGVPIGRALQIPPGIANDDLREAVAAISRVHGDGVLTPIPVSFGSPSREPPAPEADGRFTFDIAEDGTVLPRAIMVRSSAPHRQLVFLHEVGHVIDSCGLPGVGFTSASLTDEVLDEWRDAVVSSAAVVLLRRLASTASDLVAAHAAQLIRPDEMWARSYAQFVAVHSGSTTLSASLAALISHQGAGVYSPRQWSEDDFALIEIAITALFGRLGWIEPSKR